jgi:hypothetical protein
MQRSPDAKEKELGVEPTTATTEEKDGKDNSTPEKSPVRKYHNGWTRQLENVVAEWADKASCYQWMHQKTEEKFSLRNMYFTIPVIVMSTLTGTANFATESIVGGTEYQKFVTFGIGAISLVAGIISTVANFLRYAQGSEAHRVAAISWGKFQRFISIELALHPNERMDAMSFLKMGRIELDRLIEQSPPIPPQTVSAFTEEFKAKTDIIKPEIAGGIEHTRIFDDRDSRLAKIAAEAAYIIQQKKGLMRQIVLEDIDKRIVERARNERADMEEQLRLEILTHARETAREAALGVVKSQAAPRTTGGGQVPGIVFPSVRHEVNAVVPPGAVEKAKARIARRGSVIDGGIRIRRQSVSTTGVSPDIVALRNSIAAEAAAAANAANNDVQIEIVEDDGDGHVITHK